MAIQGDLPIEGGVTNYVADKVVCILVLRNDIELFCRFQVYEKVALALTHWGKFLILRSFSLFN